jgi:hypothetical protein
MVLIVITRLIYKGLSKSELAEMEGAARQLMAKKNERDQW